MITLKYSQLNNPSFLRTMQRLNGLQLPAKLAYELKKMTDQLDRGLKKVSAEYTADVLPHKPKNPEEKYAAEHAEALKKHATEVARIQAENAKLEPGAEAQEFPAVPQAAEPTEQEIETFCKASEAFEKMHEEFGERTFTVERRKLLMSKLADLHVSAKELSDIDCILEDDVEGAQDNVRSLPGQGR